MKLNNVWGYGQLFGYSAIDGVNRYGNDFVGMLMDKKICIRFELAEWIKINFPVRGRLKFKAVTGDMIDAETKDGPFFITFVDADTLIGCSPVLPKITGQKKLRYKRTWGTDVWHNDTDSIGLLYERKADGYKFCIHHSESPDEARSGANYYIAEDIELIKKDRYAYYANMPKCKNKKYERLYYKALSVNKVNVRSAEGKIPCTWTTPDRVPHRRMWLWDSVFHALAIVTYNPELAKNAIRAVLSQARRDGFISHRMCPIDCSDITQPQVLSWGVWEVYKKTGDKSFLEECVDVLERYLEWGMKKRDANGNGLLEWLTEPDYGVCKCGESGQDNSPRFDFDENVDALDFSCFLAHDAEYLSYIYAALDNREKCDKWKKISEAVKTKIDELLYDEEDGVYYDRLFSGKLTKVLTPTSFLPLFVGIPSKERAERMIKVLTDENLLWTEMPLPSVSKSHPSYSTDMWRGGVWLNSNYFVIKGLKNYGYTELAESLKNKTLETVNKWYKKTGVIFEFYDSQDKVLPFLCERKGKPTIPPDWRKHTHAISDFNWSASFTLLFIQNELY